MDLSTYRASQGERERTEDLLRLMPASGRTALDIGARDGHFSVLMAGRFDEVIALDLTQPAIDHPKVRCVQGNAASLPYPDGSMDFVFCAEVLEHIPPPLLPAACHELVRVCRGTLLIGVPYRQDTRVGRTTCYSCMKTNPPWGHVNTFDERRLAALFEGCKPSRVSFVGTSREHTNALSALLMEVAGNPYGTYEQDEPCVHCGRPLVAPPERGLLGKVATKLAFWSRALTAPMTPDRPNWIHMLLTVERQALPRRAAHSADRSPAEALPQRLDA